MSATSRPAERRNRYDIEAGATGAVAAGPRDSPRGGPAACVTLKRDGQAAGAYRAKGQRPGSGCAGELPEFEDAYGIAGALYTSLPWLDQSGGA